MIFSRVEIERSALFKSITQVLLSRNTHLTRISILKSVAFDPPYSSLPSSFDTEPRHAC